jgi:hypothetical protein
MNMTEPTTIKPKENCVELFDILARHGLERVVVGFSGGWNGNEQDHIVAFKDGKEVDIEEIMIEKCEEDFSKYEDLIDVWYDVADIAWSQGKYDEYDRYDEGNYYSGVEDGEVIFDVAKREIRLEADAKVRVVEYRYDNVSRVCLVKDDGSLTIVEQAMA